MTDRTRPLPFPQPVHGDGQQMHLLPVGDMSVIPVSVFNISPFLFLMGMI